MVRSIFRRGARQGAKIAKLGGPRVEVEQDKVFDIPDRGSELK